MNDHLSLARQYVCYPCLLESQALSHYAEKLNISTKEALLSIAQAIAASPAWDTMPPITISVKFVPQPIIAVLGYFNVHEIAHLEQQVKHLQRACSDFKYISYQQAESDCLQLARKLVDCYGYESLRQYRFAALPRGGYIVLGMLSYLLELEPRQLDFPPPLDVPLVIVDDCALSGARFADFLRRCESKQIIFAHLYSHPGLRAAIQAQEPRVIACLAAHDLRDLGFERMGEGYSAWRERWRSLQDGQRYWIGQVETICFAWNEPDHNIWNPSTEEIEAGWYLLPPELCLKNRRIREENIPRVFVQPKSEGQIRVSPDVIFGDLEDQIVIGNLKTGETFGMKDVAADMLRAIVAKGEFEAALAELLKQYDVERSVLERDFSVFLNDLLTRSLLEKS